jgi:hypothetical protein
MSTDTSKVTGVVNALPPPESARHGGVGSALRGGCRFVSGRVVEGRAEIRVIHHASMFKNSRRYPRYVGRFAHSPITAWRLEGMGTVRRFPDGHIVYCSSSRLSWPSSFAEHRRWEECSASRSKCSGRPIISSRIHRGDAPRHRLFPVASARLATSHCPVVRCDHECQVYSMSQLWQARCGQFLQSLRITHCVGLSVL